MLESECVYHIYNHANGTENLFREAKNYSYFLKRYVEFADQMVETYAYCLMPNHFHMIVKVRGEDEVVEFLRLHKPDSLKNLQGFQNLEGLVGVTLKQQFSNFSNAYAKAFNKMYDGRGGLFQSSMKKIQVTNEDYFTSLILYIHNNPVTHGFVQDPYDWPHSSIHQLAGGTGSRNSEAFRKFGKVGGFGLVWRGDRFQKST